MTRKLRAKYITYLIFISIFIANGVMAVEQFPAFPMAFIGTATLNGANLAVGTKIQAFNGDVLKGETTMTEVGVYGSDNPISSKLLVGNYATGTLVFKYILSGESTATTGNQTLTYNGSFVSGSTTVHNLAFVKTVIVTPPPPSGGGGGGGGGAPATDTVAPTNTSIIINSGATTTATRNVSLKLVATDASSMQMMISNDSTFSGAAWENFSNTKLWILSEGNGVKRVYAKFKDVLNNTSGTVNDTINSVGVGEENQAIMEPQVLGEKITDNFAEFVAAQKNLLSKIDNLLAKRLAGKILLQVQDHGEAWYVDLISLKRFYLADGARAYGALRKFGLGITNKDLAKIPVGIEKRFLDTDTDSDGLADKLEEGLGTDINKKDTDGDGVSDYDEVIKNQTNPLGAGKLVYDNKLIGRLKGRIVLQVESRGEAWYINPADGKRYYMKDGDASYQIMRFLSLGITNENLRKISIGD